MATHTIRAAKFTEIEWVCSLLGYAPCVDIKGILFINNWIAYGAAPMLTHPGAAERTAPAPDPHEAVDAAVLYDHWVPGSCEMHVWVRPGATLTRAFICEALNYPFSHGRKVIIGRTPDWNVPALEFNKRIGFTEYWRCHYGYGNTPAPRAAEDEELIAGLSFQALSAETAAAKWFPEHIRQKYYPEESWLREIKERSEKRVQESMKIPALNPFWTSKPRSKPWLTTEIKVTDDFTKLPAHPFPVGSLVFETLPYSDEVSGSAAKTSSSTIEPPSPSPENNS